MLACGYAWAAAPRAHHQQDDRPSTRRRPRCGTLAKDFNGLNTWHPALASDEIVEGKNNMVGAVRVLTLKGGGTIKEKLLAYDAKGRSFKYAIVEGVCR